MSLLDNLYPATFRGVEFLIESSNVKSGRKTVSHEFPNSDIRYVEDLGYNNETITIKATVANPTLESSDYFINRDLLKFALEQKGYGTLTHPFYGIRNCAVQEYSIAEDLNELGFIKFDVTFLVGQDLPYPGDTSSSDLLTGMAQGLINSLSVSFYDSYSYSSNNYLTATMLYDNLYDLSDNITSIGNTYTIRSDYTSDSMSTYISLLNAFKQGLGGYITSNGSNPSTDLCMGLYGLVSSLNNASNTGSSGFDIAVKLSQYKFPTLNITDTNNNIYYRSLVNNINSLQEMVRVQAFALMCRNAVVYNVKSLDDIDFIRDNIDAQYELLINSTTLSEDVLDKIQSIRAAAIDYLDQQVLTTPDIVTVQGNDLPLSIIEYTYYGDFAEYDTTDPIDNTPSTRTDDLRLLNKTTNVNPVSMFSGVKIYNK